MWFMDIHIMMATVMRSIFLVFILKDIAEAALDLVIKDLYEKEIKRDWMSTVENIQDIEVKILEIEADKLVDIELGGYCE